MTQLSSAHEGTIRSEGVVPSARSPNDASAAGVEAPGRQLLSEISREVLTACLLGLAAVVSSWSSYQATRWSGVQSHNYSQAGALRVESTRASTMAAQLQAIDVGLFTNWLNAFEADRPKLEQFYRKRFRSEFIPAFEAWIAADPRHNPGVPPNPFAMGEYKLDLIDKATRLESEAGLAFERGQAANQQGDLYVLNSVVLAVAMFFAGIGQQFRKPTVRFAMLVLATIACLIGLYHILAYPIA